MSHAQASLRVCVFCGERPIGKTNEHVLPLWLIEVTGDPKRKARFDIDWSKTPPQFREFSFDQFVAPACQACNGIFGSLENEVSPIIQTLLAAGELCMADFETLLSWLDKVRIGLWLTKYLLDKNPAGITPNFHIADRIGAHDRALILLRHTLKTPRLSFVGTGTPSFQLAPVSVALFINDFVLISVSYNDLCSRRLGFPFIETVQQWEGGLTKGHLRPGLGRIMRPIIPHFPHPEGTGFYQPIFRDPGLNSETLAPFQAEYCVASSTSKFGVGQVFQQSNGQVAKYASERSTAWLPREINFERAQTIAICFASDEQLRVMTHGLPLWPQKERAHMKEQILQIRKFHSLLKKISGLK